MQSQSPSLGETMFVSESTLLLGTKLQVMSAEGRFWDAQLDQTITIQQLKQMALDKFHPSTSSSNSGLNAEQFRLIYPAEFRTLSETHSIQDEKLQDHDIVLFTRRRTVPLQDVVVDTELKAPTMEEIMKATSHLTPINTGQRESTTLVGSNAFENWAESDFQLELRRIVIALISVMTTLVGASPDARAICRDMHAKVKNRLVHACASPIEGTSFQYPAPPEFDATPQGIIVGIVEARKREFRPNVTSLEALKSLGFKEGEIVDALRASRNVKALAAQWLAGTEREVPEDSTVGLDHNSRLFTGLVANPTVRLGLSQPKTLLAFLGIVESPTSANLWLTDPDTSPVISSIFKLYHAEKHMSTDN